MALIFQGRDAQGSYLAVGLRDEHPTHRQKAHIPSGSDHPAPNVLTSERRRYLRLRRCPEFSGRYSPDQPCGSASSFAAREEARRRCRDSIPLTSPLTLAMKMRCCKRRTVFSIFLPVDLAPGRVRPEFHLRRWVSPSSTRLSLVTSLQQFIFTSSAIVEFCSIRRMAGNYPRIPGITLGLGLVHYPFVARHTPVVPP